MSEKHFTHLHLHTDYSLLDGAISIDKLIDYGKRHKCKALAISDHGNIFAGVKFFEKCKKAGMKPVLGMEAYITDSIAIKNTQNRYYHLLLLVENECGYRNLCKLIAASFIDGFYFKPRIDYELLTKYHEGLIATTTCLGGHIPSLLREKKHDEARIVLSRMQDLFQDRYYLEVQPGIIEDQKSLNNDIFNLEKELGLPIIATGDCHYPSEADRYAHEVMLAIQTRTTMADPTRMTFGDCKAHMQTPEEMLRIFKDREDIVWRTGEVADRCNFSYATGKLFFPRFEIPHKTENVEQFFFRESREGLQALINKKRIPEEKIDIYYLRLEEELALISKMGFSTYLLIVSDFIKWSKRNGIAVGPGRGSAAGSLVSWALEITDIDPVKYNLLFERFLNPERVSMPDIDIDFCINGREKVIQYVKDKYGHDKVGQIITFGSMLAKGVIKDVARALGFSFEDANAITELVPDELKISISDALEQEPRLRNLREQNPKIDELFDIALRLEGLTRHASKHAAGIVISPEPIADVLPIYVPAKTNDIVTQYAMTELDTLGFLKMDFLGLKNLTLITNVIEMIKKNHGVVIDITLLPLEDEKTFQLLARGDTSGVFQLESSGIKDVLQRLVPQSFEDIIAVNALYRPGPLGSGMVDDFIERRHLRADITYIFPELEEVLKDTYGVIVYQEQVMKIASVIAGYSLGEADILRRAMGKKKADVMEEQKTIFVSRSISKGFDGKKAAELFDLMAYFAGYGFNKSHSAAYAMIAYQTAYLKAHYPTEFMACLITLELSNPDTTIQYLSEVKTKNISLLQPDINISSDIFVPENGNIRFGMLGIKNVGGQALHSILEERKKGFFKDLFDLCSRIDLRVCNKRVIEHLIASGACDSFKKDRAQMIANVDMIIEIAQQFQERKTSGQLGLFDEEDDKGVVQAPIINWISVPSWSTMQILEKEREVVGIYISQHPLDEYDDIILNIGGLTNEQIINQKPTYCIARGILGSLKEITTKKGDRMAFATLEDKESKVELVFFSRTFLKYESVIKSNSLLLISGDASEPMMNNAKIKVDKLFALQDFDIEKQVSEWNISIIEHRDQLFAILQDIINKQSGNQKINLLIKENDTEFIHKITQKIHIKKSDIKKIKEYNTSINCLLL
jgi:DNA polymerase-3 subunit alpha